MKAVELSLEQTRFSNPHGLQNAMNMSNAKDIIKLSCYATKNNKFKSIVNSTIYMYEIIEKEPTLKKETKMWLNTNQLL